MRSQPTVLFHPPNHIGLGHINRLSAIALALRELDARVRTPFVVEGAGHVLLESLELPYVPLPASHAMEETDCWKDWGAGERSDLVTDLSRSLVKRLDPDIAVFDCFPAPSVTAAVLEHQIPIVLCLRQMRELPKYIEFVRDLLPHVTRILIPHEEGAFSLPPELTTKSDFIGQVVRMNCRPLCGERTRRNRRIAIVGGGGGYPETVRFYNLALEAVAGLQQEQQSLECHLITGPLFEDWLALRIPAGAHVIPFEPDMFRVLADSDLVIAQAGYNTSAELELSGTKAVLVPAPRLWDDQFARAEAIARRNPHIRILRDASCARLSQLVAELLNTPNSGPISRPSEGARKAGEYLLSMLDNRRSTRSTA